MRQRTPDETRTDRAENLQHRMTALDLDVEKLSIKSGVSQSVICGLLDKTTLTNCRPIHSEGLKFALKLLNWHQLDVRPEDFVLYPLEPAPDSAYRLAERTIEKRSGRQIFRFCGYLKSWFSTMKGNGNG